MSLPSYRLGQVARIVLSITSSTDSTAGADPNAFTVGLKEPNGTTHSYSWPGSTNITSAGPGSFVFLFPTATNGVHYGGVVGSGSNAGAEEFAFNVIQRMY